MNATAVETFTELQEERMRLRKAIDEYADLHRERARLTKKMDALKKGIQHHMTQNDLQEMESASKGNRIVLVPAKKSNSTSRYTDYTIEKVMHILGDDLKKVTEIRVNADKLKGVIRNYPASIKQEIEATKIVEDGTPRFTLKK